MQVVVVILMALASAVVSAAGPGRDFDGVFAPHVKDTGARQVYDTNVAPVVARDKETVTVTVTADCTTGTVETPAVTGVSVSTGPVVIVPGTQSETGTFSIPAGGATITPGVSSEVPVPSTAEVSTPSPVLPAPGNGTSVAASVSSAPVTSTGTTTAVTTKSSTSSKSTTVESTSTEASASATPTPSATTTPATGAAVNNSAGVYIALAVALVGSVALMI